MYFYCTTQIDDYHKVGISSSLAGIKKRLITYRSAAPYKKILFFTEVNNAEELERTFKNKFHNFRIGRSECYNLRPDIIFSHVLKFIHREFRKPVYKGKKFLNYSICKHQDFFSFWKRDLFHISNFYLEEGYKAGLRFLDFKTNVEDFQIERGRNKDEDAYDLTENQLYRWDIFSDFFPICEIKEIFKRNKKGQEIQDKPSTYELKIAKLNDRESFENFVQNKNIFLRDYYEQKTGYDQKQLFKDFKEKNFEKLKIKKNQNPYYLAENYLYECLKKIKPNLLKGYKMYKSNDNWFSRAHVEIEFHRKAKHNFRITNTFQKYNFRKKMNKIVNYPLDEILPALEDINNHKDINTNIMFSSSISEERRELFQKIRRIFIKHDNDALKKIEKLINEFKKK